MPTTLDARMLRDTMARYIEALRLHREEIDSLNVFPVPDGDTGTNMLLTQQAVEAALQGLEEGDLPEVADAISRAALMGARGNSGVILSQVLRGMCARLSSKPDPGAIDLAEALMEAAEEARRAVANPVEGTMLSVLRDAAEGARDALASGAESAAVAEAALAAATTSLERTRSLLPALAAAGVVDAGGMGVVLLLDALVSALRGTPLSIAVGPLGPVGAAEQTGARTKLEYGFEVMYLFEAQDASIAPLKSRLSMLGDSLVVVGGGGMYNVHVHTNEPGEAVEAALDVGRPRGIRITSLTDQVEELCVAEEARGVRVAEVAAAGVVAVAPGPGVGNLFRSLGALVVFGGPRENPSVADLVRAIAQAPARAVILLPNHKNVQPAAEQAAEQAEKEATVVATRSVPEGIAAATVFTADTPFEENAESMREAAAAVAAGEITYALRDADTPAGPVRAGDCLGVAKGDVVVTGDEPAKVVVQLVEHLRAEGHEVLTVIVGADVADEERDRVTGALADGFPGLELEVHAGGQPHYPYLLGLE